MYSRRQMKLRDMALRMLAKLGLVERPWWESPAAIHDGNYTMIGGEALRSALNAQGFGKTKTKEEQK